jgi:hypothetical protein
VIGLARLLLSTVLPAAVLACGGCSGLPTAIALSDASISRIEDVRFDGDTVEGRVKITWATDATPSLCIERLTWFEGDLRLEANVDGPCPIKDEDPPSQWMKVKTTRQTLSKLAARPKLGSGQGEVTVRIEEEVHILSGKARPGFKLAPGAEVDLGGAVGPSQARLHLGGLLNPRVRIELRMKNALDVNLEVNGGVWRLVQGDQTLAEGPLELPQVLKPAAEFDLTIELGTAEGVKIAAGLLTGGLKRLRCEVLVQLDTPWGEVLVRSHLPLL